MGTTPFYLTYLNEELDRRQQKNQSYSLRSFARNLKIDASQLSRILRRKETLTLNQAQTMSEILSLSEKDRKVFIQSAAHESSCVSLKKIDSSLTECH